MRLERAMFVRLLRGVVTYAFAAWMTVGAGTTAASADVHGDVTGMRNRRYCELFVLKRRLGPPAASIYNTLGLNDCPQGVWTRIDTATLRTQLHAAAVIKNGPRYFLMDSIEYSAPGTEAEFEGLAMRHVADLALPIGSFLIPPKRAPYTESTIRRTTRWTFNAGRQTYRLTGPGGKHYVMQSYSRIVDPHLSESKLASLGSRLKLPAGWSYHVVTVNKVFNIVAAGTAHVVQDDFEDTYQRID